MQQRRKDTEEIELQPEDQIRSFHGNSFALLANEFALKRAYSSFNQDELLRGARGSFSGLVIHPDNKLYQMWTHFILLWAVYSSFFTPLEFGFFRGLPPNLFLLDIAGQLAFLANIILHFFVAYWDDQMYQMVSRLDFIALRYLKSSFIVDLLSCMPWDAIYKACGRREVARYLLWIRLSRVVMVTNFFRKMEKDIRINYLCTRIVKLIVVELYCTHTAACIFYYLATTLPASQEEYTWIGSLKLGDYSYSHFQDVDLLKRYLTSLYFAIVTMATVGYGDIHAVNVREMVFVMIFVSCDMILGAYLIGNMSALIVKGSKTEQFRDKMTDLIKYMNRNKLGKDISDQIKGHVCLQYDSRDTVAYVLEDIPITIRAKVAQHLYKTYIENVPLFKGCTTEFINQVVIRLHEEFFLPGEVILEQGNTVDQIYFVCHGLLEEVGIGDDGTEEILSMLEPNSSFGEITILCNIPQPWTVRVCRLCRLLRLDKQAFTNILQIYFSDARSILNNIREAKISNSQFKQLESDISFFIGKKGSELALRVNSAAFHGDLYHLKSLVRIGADLNATDYDGRSPLHLAASKGFIDVVSFLVEEGVDISSSDNFGCTPLLEAIKNGHDRVATLLVRKGALLCIDDAGTCLCRTVSKGDTDLLRRLLKYGANPNAKDYDQRTPLHIAAADGQYLMVQTLLEAGASIHSKDRWGRTPVDESRLCGVNILNKLLEDAEVSQLYCHPDGFQQFPGIMKRKKCTVYPFHPWAPKDKWKAGVVLWIPRTLDELIKSAEQQLHCHSVGILTEDAGKILDVNMISDGEKLHLLTGLESY